MKTTVIKLESYDDITSARDKMSWCRSGRILFVLPDDYHVLERRIDLALLKRYSLELGVQLGIVCSDPDVQANARQAGIPLFQSTAVAQKIPWRRSRFRHAFLDGPHSSAKLSEQQAKAKDHPAELFRGRAVRFAIFGLAILSVVALVCFFLPSATVSLPVVQQEQSLDISVWASPAITSPLSSGGIPAVVTTVILEGQDQAPASGKVITPDAASIGNIRLTNLTPQAVTVPAGTIVLAVNAGNIRFEVLQKTDVAAGLGQVAFTQVQAVEKGNSGNVGAGEIGAIEGSLGLQLSVTNLAPTQGGSDRTAISPTQSDYQALHDRLLQTLTENAAQELQKKLTPAEKLISASIALKSILVEKMEPAIGQPGDSLHLSLQAEFSGWNFQQADLASAEKFALDAGLPAGMTGLDDVLQTSDLTAPKIDQGTARWDVRVSRTIRQVWNRDAIVAQLLGKDKASALSLMTRNFGPSASFRIENQPAWWPFLPSLPFRISVVSQ